MPPSAGHAAHARGTQLLFALACTLLTPAAFAHADVRPAADAFILGRPRAAVAGRRFSGTLELRSPVPTVLDSLRLAGERWRVVRFRPPASLALGPAKRVRIAFAAVPADSFAPLVLEYRADGVRWRKYFDLSPEAVARVRGPGSVAPRAQP